MRERPDGNQTGRIDMSAAEFTAQLDCCSSRNCLGVFPVQLLKAREKFETDRYPVFSAILPTGSSVASRSRSAVSFLTLSRIAP